MPERSSIFDMIGPVMIGPSSSHTAGVVRIGKAARRIFGESVRSAVITFYNSFARTYEGHGSDRAILGGMMDWPTDDDRLRDAHQLAQNAGLTYTFRAIPNASDRHPNTIVVEMTSDSGKKMTVEGISRGGGLIAITEIDGFRCNFSAQLPTIVITAHDVKGSLAYITNIISHDECNIATMTVNRTAKNDVAKLVMEIDTPLRPLTIQYLESLGWVIDVTYVAELE